MDSNAFPKSQEWLSPPGEVTFIDENSTVKDEYESSPAEPDSPEPEKSTPSGTSYNTWKQNASSNNSHALKRSLGSSWPVGSDQEALLIRHFTDYVSHYFDFCDPKRHFGRIVPQKARSNSTLYLAVLALSSRHLSRTTTFDALVADLHYQNCLHQLIPAIRGGAKDDSLLAAIVILRLLEELDVQITGSDSQRHLVGTKAIVQAQEDEIRNPSDPSGLLHAAHWAALRQELYIAQKEQRPMQLNSLDLARSAFDNRDINAKTSDPDEIDAAWANLAVLRCCDVVQFVFGSNNQDDSRYNSLKAASEDWRSRKPSTFDPFYYRQDTPRGLPDFQMLADWHVMGHMYNLLGEILLIVHNPSEPKMSCGPAQTMQETNDNARKTIREMAGIAVSNPQSPSALLVASMGIAIYGERLNDTPEQKALIDLLLNTEAATGWPTKSAGWFTGASRDLSRRVTWHGRRASDVQREEDEEEQR